MTDSQSNSTPDNPLDNAAPAEIIELRVRAFRLGEFGLIYDSYHPDSFFRAQFPDRDEYIRYAWNHLRRDFKIRRCVVLRERRLNSEEYQLIFHQTVELADEVVESVEMGRFFSTSQGWRYHSSQKMLKDELPDEPSEIDFSDFERLTDKVFF